MDKLQIEIELFKLVQLKQDNMTIGVWIGSDNVKLRDRVSMVLNPPMIINRIDIFNGTLKNKKSYDITLAVVPKTVQPNDNFIPSQGSEIFRFTHYKNSEDFVMLKETGWSEL